VKRAVDHPSTTHRSHVTRLAAQIISPMSGRGRGRAGRPPLVAPNGRAARRRNDEASRVAGSGRDGRGVRGRGGTSYNGQGGRGRGEAYQMKTITEYDYPCILNNIVHTDTSSPVGIFI
jgi:hypothetical protein